MNYDLFLEYDRYIYVCNIYFESMYVSSILLSMGECSGMLRKIMKKHTICIT